MSSRPPHMEAHWAGLPCLQLHGLYLLQLHAVGWPGGLVLFSKTMFFVRCGCTFPYCSQYPSSPHLQVPHSLLCALLCSTIFSFQFCEITFFKKHLPIRLSFSKLFQRYCGFCGLLAAGQHPSSGLVSGHHSPSMAASGSLACLCHLVSAPVLSYFCVIYLYL